MTRNDPKFETKAADIIAFYMKPPPHAGSVTLVMLVRVEPVRGSSAFTPRAQSRHSLAQILRPDSDMTEARPAIVKIPANSREECR